MEPSTNSLVDADGRERLFHGTNIVYKGFPYLPPSHFTDSWTSLSDEDIQTLKSWGFNSVRFGLCLERRVLPCVDSHSIFPAGWV